MKSLVARAIATHRRKVWEWQLEKSRNVILPFYSSVDLRDSGHKVVPVDSNLFPAGFNNICPEDLRTAPPIFRAEVDAISARLNVPAPQKILVIPEAHTKNVNYIENLYHLSQLIQNAGYEARIGWYEPGAQNDVDLISATGKELKAHPIEVRNGILRAGDFEPQMILLNNDFSGGYPELLDQVTQPVIPSHTLGWHSRKKSEHFTYYNQLAGEFAQLIGIDPWLIQVDTEEVNHVNFNEETGTEEVAQSVERVLSRTRAAYDRHGITDKPFAFIKNNAGTYGMGIMVAHDASEIRTMNRRTKNKMSVGKNRRPIDSVAVQEGVPTATLVDRLAAEPVIYLFGSELVGGFLRTNAERGIEDNLNSPGMVFKMLCMSDLRDSDQSHDPVLELVYGSVARLSAIATGMELARHPKHTSLTGH